MEKTKSWKLSSVHLFALFAFIGVGYVLPLSSENAKIASHIYPISGGLGIWIMYLTMTAYFKTDIDEFYRGYGWFSIILSVIGVIVIGVLMVSGIALITLSAIGPVLTGPEYSQINGVLKAHLMLMAYSIMCLTCVWNRYKVKDGTIVSLDGKALYPGEKFIMWPVLVYKARIVKEKISLKISEAELECSDAKLKADIITSVKIEIEKAKQNNQRDLDYPSFIKAAKERIENLIKIQAKYMTGGKLLSTKMDTSAEKINNLPVLWDGKATYIISSSED